MQLDLARLLVIYAESGAGVRLLSELRPDKGAQAYMPTLMRFVRSICEITVHADSVNRSSSGPNMAYSEGTLQQPGDRARRRCSGRSPSCFQT